MNGGIGSTGYSLRGVLARGGMDVRIAESSGQGGRVSGGMTVVGR